MSLLNPQAPPLMTLVPPFDQFGRRDAVYDRGAGTNLKDLLLGEDSFATVLFLWASDHWDADWLDWGFEAIHLELATEWGVDPEDLSSGPADRLLAAREIVTTNRFLHSERSFVALANVLSGDTPDSDLSSLSVAEAAWAVTEAAILHPVEGWGEDVKVAVGRLLDDEDYPLVPRALRPLAGDRRNPHGGELAAAKSDEVDRTVAHLLTDLSRDVARLPLRSGDPATVLREINAARRRLGG